VSERHPEDLEPWVVANALMGVHLAILDSVRRRALDGQPNPGLARDVRFQAERTLALLETGLGSYAENDRRPRPVNSSSDTTGSRFPTPLGNTSE
jgi:hypothetical protein